MQPMSPLSWEQATSSLRVVVKGKGASRVFGSLTGFHFALLKSPHSSQCPRLFLFLSLSLFFSSYFCSFLSSCIYLSSFILAVEDKRRWFRSSKLANECHSNAAPSPPYKNDRFPNQSHCDLYSYSFLQNDIESNPRQPTILSVNILLCNERIRA